MRKLFLLGFVLAVFLMWAAAVANTGTPADLSGKGNTHSEKFDNGNVSDPAREISIADIQASKKSETDRPENVPDENVILQGGDDCASATTINALPYSNTGTTAGYTDNYNEVCPYNYSGAPDVVYKYTPTENISVTISLCGEVTSYDTKLYVYENTCQAPGDGNPPFACNDDACENSHQYYISELTGLQFIAGNTYYIVVDGYDSAEYGAYEIDVIGYTQGACCVGLTCVGNYFQDYCETTLGGRWFGGEDCASFVCPEDVRTCPTTPYASIFTQLYTGVNGVNSDIDGGYTVFDNYRTSGTIYSVHFWGIKYWFNGTSWQQCFEDPQNFTVAFWNDDGTGRPDVSAPVYTQSFLLTGTDTGDDFGSGGAPIYRYDATLTTPVGLDQGWVSVQGNPGGDPNCWFLWHSSIDGDNRSIQREDATGILNATNYDLSICLNGTYQTYVGSCCDDLTGDCVNNVEINTCPIDHRFSYHVLCANLDPPCGPQAASGVCCQGDICTPMEETACDALAGIWYSGQDCATFTCPADVVYHEDFDGDAGMGSWAGEWALTALQYVTPPNSLTDTPLGNYPDNDTIPVAMTSDLSLSGYPGFSFEFMTKFKLETGFDSVRCEISTDGGTTWGRFATFNGEAPGYYIWHLFSGDLGGYAGQNVRFKFTLISDAGYNVDGMYIDDMYIYGENTDTSPPLILHDMPSDMIGYPNEYNAVATITDYSGVASATLTYTVDGGAPTTIDPSDINGNQYTFTVPQQQPGSHINYFITASDVNDNTGSTPTYHYMAGTIVFYDDGNPEYIYQYASGDKLATRFTPTEPAVLVTGMYRIYTDANRPLDWVDCEVWADDGTGLPGTSIYGPVAVYPQSTLENPQAWTYLDFRGLGLDFDANEQFHLGYTHRGQWPVILGDSPAATDRSNTKIGSNAWSTAGTDFHIRAVLAYSFGACCNEATGTCTESYQSQCAYTFTLGATCDEVQCSGGSLCGQYVVGDYNGSNVTNVADVVDMWAKLKTGNPSYPGLLCECPDGATPWAVRADVNNTCSMNVADVVWLFGKLKGLPNVLIPCASCPPGAPAPRDGGIKPLITPDLKSKVKLNTNGGSN